jgi:hypothetical protein
MKLVIHDLDVKDFEMIFPDVKNDIMLISDDGTIKHCIGCFG